MPSARPRLRQEGGNGGGDEVLVLPQSDDQRALLPRCDKRVLVIVVHGHERVVAAQVAEGLAHRLGQVAFVVALDQVGDDLGVGLGGEGVALVAQVAPQLCVVLDDPVEDDVDLIAAVAVWMGVLLGDPAVGRPARVPEPDRRGLRRDGDRAGVAVLRVLLESLPQVGEVADSAHAVDLTVRDH